MLLHVSPRSGQSWLAPEGLANEPGELQRLHESFFGDRSHSRIIPKILKQVDGKQFTHGILVPGEKVVPQPSQDLVWLEIIGLQFVKRSVRPMFKSTSE